MEKFFSQPYVIDEFFGRFGETDDDIKDLLTFCQTSVEMRQYCNNHNIWKKIAEKKYNLKEKPYFLRNKTWMEIIQQHMLSTVKIPNVMLAELRRKLSKNEAVEDDYYMFLEDNDLTEEEYELIEFYMEHYSKDPINVKYLLEDLVREPVIVVGSKFFISPKAYKYIECDVLRFC